MKNMLLNKIVAAFCSGLPAVICFTATAQNVFTDNETAGIQAFLKNNFNQTNSCMVIGLTDEHGTKVFSGGKLDNGTDGKVDGDTVFFIGSVSKTFTALLLQDAVERGEVRLDDPVSKYLPKSIHMPTFDGKDITLFHLATHSSGLPVDPDNMTGANTREQYESYTVDQMYAFLSHHKLSRAPGTEFSYSNVGMALLGHVLALRAGTNFESLVVNRIARPLHMDSTCISLTPALKARLAMGHDDHGNPSPPWDLHAYSPAGNIHSTAKDLLEYVAPHAGLAKTSLNPVMEKTHVICFTDTRGFPGLPGTMGHTAMDWVDRAAYQPTGMELLGHAGGAGSYHAFVGFDMKQHRGVVVLSTANDISVECVGWTLLQRLPLTPDSRNAFAHEMFGLGFTFDVDSQAHELRITKVFAKSPASDAGLSAGQIVEKIENVSTAGKSTTECLALLRANGAPKVRLEVVNPDRTVTNTVEVTRGKFITSG